MTKKEFMNFVSHAREDILQRMLDLLNEMRADYCVIGGLAVNAYVEPVVSLGVKGQTFKFQISICPGVKGQTFKFQISELRS